MNLANFRLPRSLRNPVSPKLLCYDVAKPVKTVESCIFLLIHAISFESYTYHLKFMLLYTAQKMKFSIKNFFSKCAHFPADLAIFCAHFSFTFTEEILNGKLHFLCSDTCEYNSISFRCYV